MGKLRGKPAAASAGIANVKTPARRSRGELAAAPAAGAAQLTARPRTQAAQLQGATAGRKRVQAQTPAGEERPQRMAVTPSNILGLQDKFQRDIEDAADNTGRLAYEAARRVEQKRREDDARLAALEEALADVEARCQEAQLQAEAAENELQQSEAALEAEEQCSLEGVPPDVLQTPPRRGQKRQQQRLTDDKEADAQRAELRAVRQRLREQTALVAAQAPVSMFEAAKALGSDRIDEVAPAIIALRRQAETELQALRREAAAAEAAGADEIREEERELAECLWLLRTEEIRAERAEADADRRTAAYRREHEEEVMALQRELAEADQEVTARTAELRALEERLAAAEISEAASEERRRSQLATRQAEIKNEHEILDVQLNSLQAELETASARLEKAEQAEEEAQQRIARSREAELREAEQMAEVAEAAAREQASLLHGEIADAVDGLEALQIQTDERVNEIMGAALDRAQPILEESEATAEEATVRSAEIEAMHHERVKGLRRRAEEERQAASAEMASMQVSEAEALEAFERRSEIAREELLEAERRCKQAEERCRRQELAGRHAIAALRQEAQGQEDAAREMTAEMEASTMASIERIEVIGVCLQGTRCRAASKRRVVRAGGGADAAAGRRRRGAAMWRVSAGVPGVRAVS
eukprot:TRINITY_DN20539_c0_g1_i1.p1 TRINITY_DN20539_c0_g1~~TRINITY_DN20539_c0_g1_i1.p1  ORF type:complete len:652 (+),score=213.76 TRINITY_DN20539_c0_g1_i1:65-2020(+)